MFVTKHYYHGTPPALLPALEAIAQATVDEYFRLAEAVYANKEADVWNCSVYRSEMTVDRTRVKRLRIVNHSCGYWAVLQWGKPHPDLEGYKDRVDFWVYAAETKSENPTKVDWEAFESDWGYGKCSLFWQASKNPADEGRTGWYSPVHALDFKFPLLMTLTHAVDGVE